MRNLLALLFLLLINWTSLNGQCNASFTATTDCNCVTFSPTIDDPNCTYTWDFGLENATSNEMNPTFCYSFTGNDSTAINVNLQIDCMNGSTSCDSSQTIMVAQIPDAELIPLNAPGWLNCSANSPIFTLGVENASTTSATNTMYIINWGDSLLVDDILVPNIDTILPPFGMFAFNQYLEYLAYDITITVVGQNGCEASSTYTFVNSSATPDIGLELDGTSNECLGYTGSFSITNVEDNPPFTRYVVVVDIDDDIDGDTIFNFNHPPPPTFEYTFLEGSCFDTTTIGAVTYPHSFSVAITAILDSCGASTAAVGPIRIDDPPQAAFSIEPSTTLCSPLDTFHLINESIPGDYNIISQDVCTDSTWYYWTVTPNANFIVADGVLGDYNDIIPALSNPGSEDGISLVFTEEGEYTLSLVAHSILGSVCDTSMVSQIICVLPQPEASFIPSANFGCAPFAIQFENTSNTLTSCAEAEYNWTVNFLDSECGQDSSYHFIGLDTISPMISFNASGEYRVQLEVINQCDTSYFDQVVTIANPAIVEIDPIEDACISTLITPTFETLTDCYATPICKWYFPGSNNPANDTICDCNPPAIAYDSIGTYTITVEITNNCGTTVDTETFSLFALPEIPTINTNSPVCDEDDLCISVIGLGVNEIIEWSGPQNWTSTEVNTCIEEVDLTYNGLYNLMIFDTLTGCMNDTSILLSIDALPPLTTLPVDPEICIGDTTILTASGADTYEWTPAIGLSASTGAMVEASPSISTEYLVLGTDTLTGCQSSDTIFVVVNPLPIVEAGADTFACAGAPLQLGGSPEGGIWRDSTGNEILGGIYSENVPGTYSLYYNYVDNNGCFNLDSLEVCVLSNPQSLFSLDTLTECVGGIISASNLSNTLPDCQTASYRWSVFFEEADCHADSTGWNFASGGENTIDASFQFNRSGRYRIELEVANVCDTVISSQVVEIGEAPFVSIDSLGLLCEVFTIQPSAQVSACNSGNPSYAWSFPEADILSHNGPQAPQITYSSPGVYTISLTVTNNCGSTTDTYTFEIFALPMVNAQNSGPVCAGDDLVLTGSSATAIDYAWSGPMNFSSDQESLVISSISSGQAGEYTLTVTDGNGCMNVATTTVEVLDLPNVTLFSQDTFLCIGDTTILTASGADTYEWTPAIGLSASTGAMVEASPSISTEYLVLGTDTLTGCQSSDTIFVVVNPLPIVEAGADTFACAGAPLQLGGSPEGGIWRDSTGNEILGGIYSENVPGTYSLYYNYVDNNGCFNLDSLEVCVLNNPVANFELNETVGCQPFIVQATNLSNVFDDCEAAQFTWRVLFNGADCHADSTGWTFAVGGPNSQNASFIFNLSGEYTIELTVENRCGISTFSQNITVGKAPEFSLVTLDDLCNVFSIQPAIENLLACNSGMIDYEWTFGPDATPSTWNGATPPEVVFADFGPKSISISVSNPCGTTTETVNFEIYALPSIEVTNNGPLCVGDELQLTANSDTGTLFSWQGPDSFSADEQNPMISNVMLINAGVYSVVVTDPVSGCMNESSTELVVNVLPVVDAGVDRTFCPEDPAVDLNGNPANGSWSGAISPDGNFNPSGLPAGEYELIYTYEDPGTLCIASDTIITTVYPMPIQDTYFDSLCIEESVVINGTLYDFNNPSGVEVFVSQLTGCDSLILTINLGFWDIAMETAAIDPNCFDEDDGSIIIEAVTGGTLPYSYSLDGSTFLTIDTFPVEIPMLGAGFYNLVVEDAQGCVEEDDNIILNNPDEVILTLGDDVEIDLGDQVKLEALISPPVFGPIVRWNSFPVDTTITCDSCAAPIVQPIVTTTYTATYIDAFGCEASDEITIFVDKQKGIFMPNIFSPNEDGMNDLFYVQAGENVKTIKRFLIFDRWGELVFNRVDVQANDPQFGWNGTFRGQDMNPQVFVWFVEAEMLDGSVRIFKGDLTLIR